MLCNICFSLGMTILELASDLDLPRGGDGWHILRQGHLPDEFLRGRYSLLLEDISSAKLSAWLMDFHVQVPLSVTLQCI